MVEAPQNKETARASDPSGRASGKGFRAGSLKAERGPVIEITRKEMITALRRVGPLSEDLSEAFAIPDTLYTKDNQSYSASKDSDPAAVSASLLFGTALPEAMPEYSIHIFGRGSNTYCVLVDAKRKVIVMDRVNHMQAESGHWGSFTTNLRLALEAAGSLISEGADFRFLVSENGLMRRV